MNPPTAAELAHAAIKTLDAQRVYFRDRSPQDLALSKRLEAELRKLALAALNPPQPQLF